MIDYTLNYAEYTSSSFTVYQSGLLTTSLTVTSLTPGVRYKFNVQARNIIGFSSLSSELNVLAAQIPDPPTDLANNPSITNAD